MSARSGFAPDAAMALGIAATAMPFARTPRDEAERWLRVLRLHGDVGATLQALGVSEGSLDVPGESGGEGSAGSSDGELGASRDTSDRTASRDAAERAASVDAGERARGGERDVVAQVSELAAQRAGERGAAGVTTSDVLAAVMDVYGADFDAVLRAHGTDRDEVLGRLGDEAASS